MFNSKKRAAVIVPTAFLVAVSGLVAAPAMAFGDQPITPQAYVDGYNADSNNGRRTTEAKALQVQFVANPEASVAGTRFWVEVELDEVAKSDAQDPDPVYYQIDVPVDSTATRVNFTLDASGAQPGDVYTLTAVEAPDGEDLASFGNDTAAKTAAFNDAVGSNRENAFDYVDITIDGTQNVTVDPVSVTALPQGVPGNIVYRGLADGKTYVAATADRIVDESVDTAVNTVEYTPSADESGAVAINLYQVDAAVWNELSDQQKLTYLAGLPTQAKVNTHTVNVTAPQPDVILADNYIDNGSTAFDGKAVAGSTVELSYTNLPKSVGNTYELRKYVDNVQVDNDDWPTTVTVDDPNNDGLWDGEAQDELTAAEAGKMVRYSLVLPGGKTLDKSVEVLRPTAKLTDPTKNPVMVGDDQSVTFENVDGQRYVLVTTTAPAGQAATSVVADAMGGAPTPTVNTGQAQTVDYQLYYVPENQVYPTNGTDAEQLRWLNANAVAQLATPYRVQVQAEDARVTVDKPLFDNTVDTTLNFAVDNLDELTAEYPATYGILTTDDGAGKVTHRVVDISNGTHQVNPTADKATYTLSVYDGPKDSLEGIAGVGDDPEKQAAYLMANHQVIKSNAGQPLTATAVEKDSPSLKAVEATAAAPSQSGNTITLPTVEGVEYLIDGVVRTGSVDITKDVVVTVRAKEGFTLTNPNASWTFKFNATQVKDAWTGKSATGATIPGAFHQIPTDVTGDNIFVGDWNGDGIDTPAYRTGVNEFRFAATNDVNTTWSEPVTFGREGDQVFVGDWDGNGTQTLGLRRGITVYLFNSNNVGGNADIQFDFGREGDQVVVGDWNGDGIDTIALRRGITNFISNGFKGGWAETDFTFGRTGDVLMTGDWDGDGEDTLAVRRGTTFFTTNELRGGWAETDFTLGTADQPAVVSNVAKDDKDHIFVLEIDEAEVPATPAP